MTRQSSRTTEIQRSITLHGLTDIMFDRYAGDNKTELAPGQKLNFDADGKTVVVPSVNIMSFLCAQNTRSAAKRFMDARKYMGVAEAILSYVAVSPFQIPLTREGTPVVFHGFDGDEDEKGGLYIHRCVARLPKGIPNPKVRPVVRLPWELSFNLTMFQNEEVSEDMLQSFFVRGGMAIGLGTFRGVFGKFKVAEWKEI